MQVFGLPRAFYHTARHSPHQLSPQAKKRLRWLSAWEAPLKERLTTREAPEALGISTASLYRCGGLALTPEAPGVCKRGAGSPRTRESLPGEP
jgi:hypothetical protein